MTNGSTQGLFVIVAVVIFGIFVVISYLLFRDKLQTGLTSIFTDSTYEVQNNLNPNLVKDFGKSGNWIASIYGTIFKYKVSESPKQEQLPSGIPDMVIKYEKGAEYNGGVLSFHTSTEELGLKIGDIVEVSALLYVPKKLDNSSVVIGMWDVKDVPEKTWTDSQLTRTDNYSGGTWFRYSGTSKVTNDLKKVFVAGISLSKIGSEKTEIYIADFQIKKIN